MYLQNHPLAGWSAVSGTFRLAGLRRIFGEPPGEEGDNAIISWLEFEDKILLDDGWRLRIGRNTLGELYRSKNISIATGVSLGSMVSKAEFKLNAKNIRNAPASLRAMLQIDLDDVYDENA